MNSNARGKHIFLDFTEFFPNVSFEGHDMLVLMKKAIESSGAREVHAHVEEFDRVALPEELQNNGEHYGLKVKGDSMIEAGIIDGDTVIVKKTSNVDSGQIAVVLIDESHVSAHCYSDRGLLAIDAFTCGNTDPTTIITQLKQALRILCPRIVLMQEKSVDRFLPPEA